VRAELSRRNLLAKTDRYLADLVDEIGPPRTEQRERAAAVARRLACDLGVSRPARRFVARILKLRATMSSIIPNGTEIIRESRNSGW